MEDFNLFVIGVLGALGGFMVILQKSKCESICWGCCKRDVKAVIEEEKLQITGHTGTTPRRPSLAEMNKKVKLELKRESEEEEENFEPAPEPSKN